MWYHGIGMPPHPKPSRRLRATEAEWEVLRRKLDENRCRGCGRTGRELARVGLGLSLHHVVPKSLGGDDAILNLIPLCGSGTTGCHGAIETHTKERGVIAARIRSTLTVRETGYALRKKGRRWLDRYYSEGELT